MSLLTRIKNLPRKHLLIGIVGGILVSIIALLLLNSLVLGYPTDPSVYQYDYPPGTNVQTPLTHESVVAHASGVALSHTAYEVNYTSTTTYTTETGEERLIQHTDIYYQINNKDAVGWISREVNRTGVIGEKASSQFYAYENNSTAFIKTANTTKWQPTGNEPIVLSNQLRLPQKLVKAVPHIQWEPTGQRAARNNSSEIVYTATGASASQMPYFDSITSTSGTLTVNTKTSVITYSVTVQGTRTLPSGETVTVTRTQKLTYNILDESAVPTRPEWATKQNTNSSTSSSGSDSDTPWS